MFQGAFGVGGMVRYHILFFIKNGIEILPIPPIPMASSHFSLSFFSSCIIGFLDEFIAKVIVQLRNTQLRMSKLLSKLRVQIMEVTAQFRILCCFLLVVVVFLIR
ncbi:hypothetical protein MTR67_027677 [Solanum verrucosum]|uniref:Uncharacterized protein n=1 Tax=Solanum verrucosum TaxID=315347 RepID=A0AAF0R5K2_SOLVR|nr:hypothetical protein MTR67_027677 [Solanum verrucosum]